MKKKSYNYLKRRRKTPLLSFLTNVACFILLMGFIGLTTNVMADNSSSGVQASQQQTTVTGKIVDQDGAPIPGVTVLEKGTTNGTATDMDGNYTLTVAGTESILVFSAIGKITQEITVGAQTEINLTMEEDIEQLDEVVVIGYGSVKKSDLTGAVSSVKSDVVEKFTVSHPAEALQGRVAGVSIQTSNGGEPGSGMNIRVRGIGTTGDNAPLYIIDGLPGSMYMLNPDDIASIEVLKDGAAAAIYGSRAANGVVLITTKSGKKGEMQIQFNANYGVVQNTNEMKFTNAEQYVNTATLAYQNAGQPLPTFLTMPIVHDTDWQDAIFRKGSQQNVNVRVSGATETLNYSLSSNYFKQDGTMIGTGYEKSTVRAKGEMKKGKFKLSSNIAYSEDKQDEQTIFLRGAYEMLPLIPILDPTQPSGYGLADIANDMPSGQNPVGVNDYYTEYNKDHYLEGKITAELNPIEGLTYKVNLGLNNSDDFYFSHNPPNMIDAKDEAFYTYLSEQRTNWREEMMEHILTYTKEINNHSITLMGAVTKTKETYKVTGVDVTGYKNEYEASGDNLITTEVPAGFLDPYFQTLNAGEGGTFSGWGQEYTYTRSAILGRINYSYDSKYLLQATMRRDGSSKFGANKRYGIFPSVSAGWKISNESFMQNISILSNLKLRASWGILGSEGILDNYDYQSLINTSAWEFYYYSKGTGESPWAGSIARTLENRELRWEELRSINVGIDFGLLEGKINGTINYYDNKTTDMLVDMPVPASTGISTPRVNFGEISNKGFEIELGFRNVVGDLKYSVSGTLGANKNEVLKLGTDDAVVFGEAVNYTEHYPNQTRVGEELGAFYLYQMDGIFQSQDEVNAHNSLGAGTPLQPYAEPGDIRFKDVNGDGVLDDDDIVYSGTGIPKYEFGLAFDAEYKGIDLSITLNGAGGHKIYNANRYYTERMNNNYNYAASAVDAWTVTNPSTTMPRPVVGDPNQNSRVSTRFLEDGDYIRIKNIQLGYSLPASIINKVDIEKCRIYVSAQNLATFTKYSGFDPEVSRSSIWSSGLDRTLYPIPRTILMGIQLSF